MDDKGQDIMNVKEYINCPKCGEKNLKYFTSFCSNCGEDLAKDKGIMRALLRHKKVLAITLAFALIIGYLLYLQIGKLILKEALSGEWSRLESFFFEDLVVSTLEFHDNNIDYYYDDMITPIDSMEYKVVAPNKIKIIGRDDTFKIVFNKENVGFTVYPAITSDSESEGWNSMKDNDKGMK